MANEFANAVLSDLSHADVNALHRMINTQKTQIILSDTSRFTDLSDTIKGAVRMSMWDQHVLLLLYHDTFRYS